MCAGCEQQNKITKCDPPNCINPVTLELSSECTLQTNGCPLVCMSLAVSCSGHWVFSASHCVSAAVYFAPESYRVWPSEESPGCEDLNASECCIMSTYPAAWISSLAKRL